MATDKRRKKGSGTIIKQKDGTYIARMTQGKKANGRPNTKSRRAKTLNEAKDKLKEIKKEFERESTQGEGFVDYTVKEYFDRFLEFKRGDLKDTSFMRLESVVYEHIISDFEFYRFCELDDSLIREHINSKKDNGLSYSSVKKIYEAFTACYKYAITQKDIKAYDNPMLAVNMISRSKFDNSKSAPRYLRKDKDNNERKRFVEEALRRYKTGTFVHRYGPALVLMLHTGMREGEIAGLSNKNINLEENIVYIKDTAVSIKKDDKYQLVIKENDTKWDSVRAIPLNEKAVEMIEVLRSVFGEDGLLIKTKTGGIVRPETLNKTFNEICDIAGITENMKNVGTHCLRHTFATAMFEQGEEAKVISEILGHKSITVTMNTYVSVINELKMKAVSIPSVEE